MRDNNAVAIAPEVHTILFEDGRVRVLNVLLPTGQKTKMHWHPENISYILQGGKMRVTKSDNSTIKIELVSGAVLTGKEGEHIVENIGDSDIRTVQVEFL